MKYWRSAGLALAICLALSLCAVAQDNDADDQPISGNGYYGINNGYGYYGYPVPSDAYPQTGYAYPSEQQYASQNGFQDGFAKGQQDRAQNKQYKYNSGENWEDATHGYNKQMGPKNDYKQWYRQAFIQGYNDGYYGRAGSYGPYGPPPVNAPYGYNGPYGPVYQGPYPNPYPYGAPVYQGNLPNDPAFQYGYRDGVTYGQGDARNGRSFDDHRGDAYHHADDGYNKSYGDKDDYQSRYRQGYVQGYRAGWSQVTGAMPPR